MPLPPPPVAVTAAVANAALYLPNSFAVRRMAVGDEWQTLTLGVMVRQRRAARLTAQTLAGFEFAFGLSAGTAHPYGSVTPDYFVGLRSKRVWQRGSGRNWWTTGWELFTVTDGVEQTLATGNDGALNVAGNGDQIASAWYLRFTREPAALRIDLFVPNVNNSPTLFDFENQLDCERFQTNVNNHRHYRSYSASAPAPADVLDSVNLMSDLPNFVTSELRGLEWLAVKAVRFD